MSHVTNITEIASLLETAPGFCYGTLDGKALILRRPEDGTLLLITGCDFNAETPPWEINAFIQHALKQ